LVFLFSKKYFQYFVRSQFAVLPTQAELDCEEVAGGQLGNVIVRGADRSKAELMRELGKCGIGQ